MRVDRYKRSAGFTLVEIMIVVSIMGIIALMAGMFWRGQMPRNRVNDVADRLQAQLRAARLYAISAARPVSVSLDPGARVLTTSVDENGDGSIVSNEVSRITLSTVSMLKLFTTSTGGVFRASGSFSCPAGYWRVVVRHAGASDRYVYVLQGGHVQATEQALE